jgi:hypothetical protein
MVPHVGWAEEASALQLFTEGITRVERAYSNFELRGDWVMRNIARGEDRENVPVERRAFAQLNDRWRLTAIAPLAEHANEKRPQTQTTYVAHPEQSFILRKVVRGGQQLKGGGLGREPYERMFQAVLFESLVVNATCTIARDSVTEMLTSGKLVLEDQTIDPVRLPKLLTFKILRWEPSQRLNPEDDTIDNALRHYTGKLVVLPSRGWAIARIEMTSVMADGTPGKPIEIVVTYNEEQEEIPKMTSVRWKSEVHDIQLSNCEITLGSQSEMDFTPGIIAMP